MELDELKKQTEDGIFKGGSESFWTQHRGIVLDVCGKCGQKQDGFRLKPIQSLYSYEKNSDVKLNLDEHNCEGINQILISHQPEPGYEPWYLYCCVKGGLCRYCINGLNTGHTFFL